MPVLVTGATGFLGGNLVQHLLDREESVRILVRSTAKAVPLIKRGAEVASGDIADRDALRAALRDVDIVYHLAGRLLVAGVPKEVYERTHVEGTRVLLECCQNQPRLRRFVHCSTSGVLGPTGDRPADETAPAAPTNVYEETKWQAELLVRQATKGGLPTVIIRPGLVYGPGDLHLLSFFKVVQRGLFRPIGDRPAWVHPIYVDDLIEAFIRCAHHPRAVGECFHIAGQKPVTLGSLAAAIAVAVGVPPPQGTMPLFVARVAALAAELLPGGLKQMAPMTQDRLRFLTSSRMYDVSKAERLLGFKAPTELATGVALTVAWYRAQGYLPTAGRTAVLEGSH